MTEKEMLQTLETIFTKFYKHELQNTVAISLSFDNNLINILYYVNKNISDDEKENLRCLSTEFLSSIPIKYFSDFREDFQIIKDEKDLIKKENIIFCK